MWALILRQPSRRNDVRLGHAATRATTAEARQPHDCATDAVRHSAARSTFRVSEYPEPEIRNQRACHRLAARAMIVRAKDFVEPGRNAPFGEGVGMACDVVAGLSVFKTMFGIAKSMRDMNDAVIRNAAVADLCEQIISAQERYTAAVGRVGELGKELVRFETWEVEKRRYELKDMDRGFFAYIPKEGEERGEPPHALCANCYQRGIKSILQSNGSRDVYQLSWDCSACQAKHKCMANNMRGLVHKARQPSKVES